MSVVQKFQTWLTPGTITSLVSTLLVIGSFIGVSNYRAQVQDKSWDEFRQSQAKSFTEFRSDVREQLQGYDKRLDGFEHKIDNMSKDNLDNIRLQARFESLEKDLSRLTMDNRELNGKTQAQWDSLSTRLSRLERN